DGEIACGESNIPKPGRRIRRVWLESAANSGMKAHMRRPLRPPAAPGVIKALYEADAIVVGPGSLYTSLIPNLLTAGVAEAIQISSEIKIYVCNLMTQSGETAGFSAADHVRSLLEYVSAIDVCVLNSSPVGAGVADRYMKPGSLIVSGTADDQNEVRKC